MNEPALHVFEAGQGPPVVLLHGLPSPPEDLEALATELPGHRVLVPHLPGYGATPRAAGHQGVAAVQAALFAALATRGVERPVIVGFSMGAFRALHMAVERPVAAVVALAGISDLSGEERAGMRGFAAALRAKQDLRPALPPRFLSPRHRAEHPEDDARVEAWADVASPEVLIEELDDLASAPLLLPRLATLRCPVVARTGELDCATPPSHARAIVAAVASGTLEIAPGAGHALLLEDRSATLATIRRVCAATS
jgi:pimeloyl-ACP methyl ester carboxylesterase